MGWVGIEATPASAAAPAVAGPWARQSVRCGIASGWKSFFAAPCSRSFPRGGERRVGPFEGGIGFPLQGGRPGRCWLRTIAGFAPSRAGGTWVAARTRIIRRAVRRRHLRCRAGRATTAAAVIACHRPPPQDPIDDAPTQAGNRCAEALQAARVQGLVSGKPRSGGPFRALAAGWHRPRSGFQPGAGRRTARLLKSFVPGPP